MKVYVAGKITGLDRSATVEKFNAAARILTDMSFDVLVPTVLPVLEELSYMDYLHICFAMIDVCDAVVFLPDWEQSQGAKLERDYARRSNKKIWYYSELTSIK